ncbi:MAG: polysaccharide biosynthesis/export family protein [Pseudomonadota bacterium]
MTHFKRIWTVLVAALVCALLVSPLQADPYVLQPGDTLRISITELPEMSAQSTIDIDGNVQVPRLGLFPAAGKTLAEFDEAVSVASAGLTIALYNSDGERRQVILGGTELMVEIVSYRPIYVTGDVARQGLVDFQPGMTVRTAIASAGGMSTVPVLFEDALQGGPNLLREYQTATLEHAAAVVRLWGIDATLARRADTPREAPIPVQVAPGALRQLFDSEQRRVELALRAANVTRGFLRQQLDYLTDRVARLNEELDNTAEGLSLEEEDVDRIRQLQERGLAAAARLSDARQSLLLVSSRVLSVQDSVARFTLERDEIGERLNTFDERFEEPLIAERAQVLTQIWTLESRAANARRALALNGQAVEAFGVSLEPRIAISIRRGVAPDLTVIEAELDTAVRPGDVIDVDVTYDYASLQIDPPQTAAIEPEPSTLPETPQRQETNEPVPLSLPVAPSPQPNATGPDVSSNADAPTAPAAAPDPATQSAALSPNSASPATTGGSPRGAATDTAAESAAAPSDPTNSRPDGPPSGPAGDPDVTTAELAPATAPQTGDEVVLVPRPRPEIPE